MLQILMERIGRQIGPVRPANRSKVINEYLAEQRSIPQRRKHRTEKTISQGNDALSPVIKRDFQAIVFERSHGSNAWHSFYSNGAIGFNGL